MGIVFEQSNPQWHCPPIPAGVYRYSPTQPVAIANGKLKVSVVGVDLTQSPQCSVIKINEHKVIWSCGTLEVTNVSKQPVTVKVTNHRQFAPGDRTTNVKDCLSEVAEAIPGTEEKRTIQPGETVRFVHLEFDQLPQLPKDLPLEQRDAVSVLEVESFPWLWVIGLAGALGLVTYIALRRR